MWKPIILDNQVTNYECSDAGFIRNIKTHKILKPAIAPNGYAKYGLYINGISKTVSGHRMVAQCFINNPNNYPQVNHIDGNKLNNNVSNLEWCSVSHNNKHAWDNGLNNADSTSVPVAQYTLDGKFIKKYSSFEEARRQTGIVKVRAAAVGERNTAGGYKWVILDDNYEKRDMGKRKRVGQFTLDGDFITEFESASEASRITGCYRKGISDCCNGKIKQSKGYIWRFI